MKSIMLGFLSITVTLAVGCQTSLINRTDRDVYGLIQSGQMAALGVTTDTNIGAETGELATSERMYKFNPRPLEPGVPEAFRTPSKTDEPPPDPQAVPDEAPATATPPQTSDESTLPELDVEDEIRVKPATDISASIFGEDELDQVTVFSLKDAMVYANRHARRLQDAKEDLYLSALDLTLERHLWTPQFAARISADVTEFSDDSAPLERSLSTVSEVSVSQRLPYGGDVTARMIHSLVRDVSDLVSKGESGQVIIDAQLPLLRGAGRVAYESRYLAERELVYAIRTYERFRRAFLVGIAGDYFNLQQAKAQVTNTYLSYVSNKEDWVKQDFIQRMGRSRDISELPRAAATFRRSEAGLVSGKERYESALDRFKIRVGMPVGTLLDVLGQDEDEGSRTVEDLLSEIDAATAIDVALEYRLDFISSADRLDDRRRGVVIARNRILPDLDLTGRVAMDSDPLQLRSTSFREERLTWQGGIELRVDDRKAEQNAFRSSLLRLRRAKRDHEEFSDDVRADVRAALRSVKQQENLRLIETLNVNENIRRHEAARAQNELGRSTNQDVVDASNDLLSARNNLAAAVADYRLAILAFRLDTGTLRIADDGSLAMGNELAGAPDDGG